MNYLAHCFLTAFDEEILTGNFMADFITGPGDGELTPGILKGIEIHRGIDSYTDLHPSSSALRALLRKRHRKYSPVVVDLIWDYYLSINWERFHKQSLRDFADKTYNVLLAQRKYYPVHLNGKLEAMIDSDFLLAYSTKKRMKRSLAWMDRRARFPSNFTGAIEDIDENQERIQSLFDAFMPDIVEFVNQRYQKQD